MIATRVAAARICSSSRLLSATAFSRMSCLRIWKTMLPTTIARMTPAPTTMGWIRSPGTVFAPSIRSPAANATQPIAAKPKTTSTWLCEGSCDHHDPRAGGAVIVSMSMRDSGCVRAAACRVRGGIGGEAPPPGIDAAAASAGTRRLRGFSVREGRLLRRACRSGEGRDAMPQRSAARRRKSAESNSPATPTPIPATSPATGRKQATASVPSSPAIATGRPHPALRGSRIAARFVIA